MRTNLQTNLRTILVFAVAAVPAVVFGQKAPTGGPSAPPIKIVLYPAPEPRPALKYQLLPPFLERRPGNAAVWWNRIPAEQANFFMRLYAKDGPWEHIEKWMEIPLGDPREKAYREKELAKDIYIIRQWRLFSDMERAARFESCDWEQPIREGGYITMLIPEIGQARTFARLLSAKAHLEIAEGKYDEAVRTLQTGYSQARQVAQSPILVSSVVAAIVANIMSNQVQQFIQRPDAPNLYWALSTLPRPVVDFRLAAETESKLLYLQFPELRDLDKKRLSPDEWRDLLERIKSEFSGLAPFFSEVSDSGLVSASKAMTKMMSILEGYPLVKRYLVEHGHTAAEVEAMPVAQAVLLYSVKLYDELSDEQFKWFFMPVSEADKGPQRAERKLRDAFAAKREIIPMATLLIPASTAAKEDETRSQWNIAMLRVFEAMRLYAANHDGRWPNRLSDVTEVPIPINPYDGRPFIYQRQGDKAILTSAKGPPNLPWRYEITLMSKAK